MNEVKLEPCPFCGSDEAGIAKGRLYSYGQCGRCGATSSAQTTNEKAAKAWNRRAPHPSHAAVEAMAQALEKARPILESELQSMCESYCPPCKEGDVFDYSKLKQPELGWITATEEALDNTDAALDAYRATQNKDARP